MPNKCFFAEHIVELRIYDCLWIVLLPILLLFIFFYQINVLTTFNLHSTRPLLGEPPVTCGFPSQRANNTTSVLCHNVSMVSSSLNSFNSLASGKSEWNFRHLIFQITSVVDGWGIPCELAFRWMSLDLTDEKSTLVQVMAWCRQAPSHDLSQCWRR